jgi:hypothetical protein
MELVSETNTLNITEYVGDTVRVSLLYTDSDGIPIDLSTEHLRVEVRDKSKVVVLAMDSDVGGTTIYDLLYDSNGVLLTDVNGVQLTSTEPSTVVIPREILINTSSTENISFAISSAQTTLLGVGSWTWSLVITYTDGFVNTLVIGKLKLKAR